MRSVMFLAFLGAIAACTTSPTSLAPDAASAAPDAMEDRVVCRRETSVGTHLPHTVCEKPSDAGQQQAARERTRDMVRGMQDARATGGDKR
jgi:hypothetical protein